MCVDVRVLGINNKSNRYVVGERANRRDESRRPVMPSIIQITVVGLTRDLFNRGKVRPLYPSTDYALLSNCGIGAYAH